MYLPHIDDTGGEAKHTFRFWVQDKVSGVRAPMELGVDNQFNAVFLRVDGSRAIQGARVIPSASDAPRTVTVDPQLAKAHMKLCGGKQLENADEERVRLNYLSEMEKLLATKPNCPGCERGAVTRKYQEKMLAC